MSTQIPDLRKIDLSELRNVILLGSEHYLISKYTNIVKERLTKVGDFEIDHIYSDEVKTAQLNDSLYSYSLFSERKLILIKNASSLAKKDVEVIAEYTKNPQEHCILIVQADKIDSRLSAWKIIKENSLIIECEKPSYAGMIKSWLQDELKASQKRMANDAIEEFINRVDLDYGTCDNEYQKLLLLIDDKNLISLKDVHASLGTSRTGALIDLKRAIGKRQTTAIIDHVNKLLSADWEPLQVLFQVQKLFWVIWRIVLLKQNHISNNEIVSQHLFDEFQNQRKELLEFAANYNLQSIKKVFGILLDLDTQLKSSNTDPQLLLTVALYNIASS